MANINSVLSGFDKSTVVFELDGNQYAVDYTDEQLAEIFLKSKFYLEYQMDIHPRSPWYNNLIRGTNGGFFPSPDTSGRKVLNPEPGSQTRRDMIILLLRSLIKKDVPGEMIEVGVYRGWSAALIHHYCPERKLHLFDTFKGFTDDIREIEKNETGWEYPKGELSETSIGLAQKTVSAQNDNVSWYEGVFPETWPEKLNDRIFSFVHFDPDLKRPILEGLKLVYPRMAKGGMILIHDYMNLLGAWQAVEEFMADKPEMVLVMPDKAGSALIVKE